MKHNWFTYALAAIIAETMLLSLGWQVQRSDPDDVWVNPRTKHKYTIGHAVACEHYRDKYLSIPEDQRPCETCYYFKTQGSRLGIRPRGYCSRCRPRKKSDTTAG